MSLYNEFRPKTFDEVYGQPEAVKLLSSIVAQEQKKRPRVFLMSGSSGCGKTTLVRIFAEAIGCKYPSCDFHSTDASKDRSIETIRRLTESMGLAPMMKGSQGRVFLIDECHQLLKPAQEALLKSCEDVPPHTYIFFATTEPENLGTALKSRCKTINILPMDHKSIFQSMRYVADKAGIPFNETAFKKMTVASNTNARTSLQILENYMLNGFDCDAAIKMNAGADGKMKADTMVLCKAIIGRSRDWAMVKNFMDTYKGNAEGIRQCIMGYLKSCVLNAHSEADRQRSTAILECFIEPLHYSGDAGIVYQISNAFDAK